MSGARRQVLLGIADQLCKADLGHPLRVAIDGITSSGESTIADEIADLIRACDRRVIRIAMDGFHHPRAHRHRQGRLSGDGYYEDAYDLTAAARDLLEPLGPGGSLHYRTRIIDLQTDTVVDDAWATAAVDDILLVDGSFLQRPEIRHRWDEVVYLDVDFGVALRRGVTREAGNLGGAAAAAEAFEKRYHAAGRRYLNEIDPIARASFVLDNNDLDQPVLH